MSLFLIIVLSVIMVIDCAILVVLVLMQLPKKEAGAGLAFGGAATDALFGAGSGNFLTKATKYSGGIFFALALILSILQSYRAHQSGSEFQQRFQEQQNARPVVAPPPLAATPAQPSAAPTNNGLMQVGPTNVTSGPAQSGAAQTAMTNAAPAKAPAK
ncbi:MAG TPA: preprotein translocase subunit SecG [Candidatus Angelobacter sp.]|nr:preprotein translocase subunit SecG [Candidatus Angelobacter sp.]